MNVRSYKVYNNLPIEDVSTVELFICYVVMRPQRFEKLLDVNAQLKGYVLDEYTGSLFANECEPDDEEYFGDSGIDILIDPPAAPEQMHQWLSLDEYYAYLEDYANCYLANKSQEEKQRVYAKLAKVKEAFRHAK